MTRALYSLKIWQNTKTLKMNVFRYRASLASMYSLPADVSAPPWKYVVCACARAGGYMVRHAYTRALARARPRTLLRYPGTFVKPFAVSQ